MKVTTVKQIHTVSDPIPLVEVHAADYQEPLIISTFGDEGAGKSYLIGTAPGDIGVIPMEAKSRAPILKAAAEFGRKVIMPEKDLIRTGNAMLIAMMPAACVTPDKWPGMKEEDATKRAEREMEAISKDIRLDGPQPECCARHYYRWHINRVKSVAFRMAASDSIRTIGIDTFGQFVEDMLFANYGRTDRIIPLEKKSFNQEVRDFLNAINHKNLILTHHAAQIWVENKPTNKYKPASTFSKIGHYVNVAIKQERDRRAELGEDEPRYTLTVLDSTANPTLIGVKLLTDELITFQNLAWAVFPDSDEGAWE